MLVRCAVRGEGRGRPILGDHLSAPRDISAGILRRSARPVVTATVNRRSATGPPTALSKSSSPRRTPPISPPPCPGGRSGGIVASSTIRHLLVGHDRRPRGLREPPRAGRRRRPPRPIRAKPAASAHCSRQETAQPYWCDCVESRPQQRGASFDAAALNDSPGASADR